MTEAVKKYRKNNPKCVFCPHLDTRALEVHGADKLWWCLAKMKSVKQERAYALRPFCSCYDVREEK